MSVFTICKSQSNEQEAQLTYQLAQEEYEKSNYLEAIKYLDKVESLSEQAKVKTSYLKAKCFENLLFKENSIDEYYLKCIEMISFYNDYGKDVEKKNELLKLKLKLENSENYKLLKYFKGYSPQQLKDTILSIFQKHKNNVFDEFHFSDKEKYFYFVSVEYFNRNDLKSGILKVYSIPYNRINLLRKNTSFKTEAFTMVYLQKNEDKRFKIMRTDLEKYLNGDRSGFKCYEGGTLEYSNISLIYIINTSDQMEINKFLKALEILSKI